MKLSVLILLLISFTGMVNALECSRPVTPPTEQRKPAMPSPNPTPTTDQSGTMNTETKELAASTHCSVFESFVFVAREPQGYAALKNLNINVKGSGLRNSNIVLPEEDAAFFKTHAVIAAFLGQRRTGGFGIDITKGADGVIKIAERKPRGMVIMSLTTPFKIVAVPVNGDEPITLSLDETWKDRLRTYKVAHGTLTITGGFAGIREESSLSGTLQIMRAAAAVQPSATGEMSKPYPESLVTVIVDLKSTGKRQGEMRDVAGGTVLESGQLNISYLNSYQLSGAIQSPFRTTGQFSAGEQELTLTLETVAAPNVSDNFAARASVKAAAVTPPPANRAISGHE